MSKFSNLMSEARKRVAEDEASPTAPPDAAAPPAMAPTPARTPAPAPSPTPPSPVAAADPGHAPTGEIIPGTVYVRRGRPPGKRSNPEFEQISAYIGRQTHRDVKIALLQEGEGREFSELVQELLVAWLKSRV